MKLHVRLFQLLIILLPTQLGLHFWPSWSHVFGIRVDYLSPTIFLTDIVFALVLGAWLHGLARQRQLKFPTSKAYALLALFLALNVYVSPSPWLTIYKWIKFLEILSLGYYVYRNAKILHPKIFKPLSFALVYTLVIAIAQLARRSSIGGLLYFLGERSFTISTPGISLFELYGREFLRPYATFPHPNALAGFALISILFLLSKKKKNLTEWFGIVGGVFVITISWSANAWMVGLLSIVLLIVKGRFVKTILFLVIVLSISLPVISVFLISRTNFSQEIAQRLEFSIVAGKLFSQQPFVGNGLGSFVVLLPQTQLGLGELLPPRSFWFLQPVHNVYLLLLAEVGLVGMMAFLFFVIKTMRKIPVVILAVVLTGLVDHYWLTLQQTQFLLVVALGLFLSLGHVRIKGDE